MAANEICQSLIEKRPKKPKKAKKVTEKKAKKIWLWKKTQTQLLMSLLPSDSACERKWTPESILCVSFAFLNLTDFFKDLSIHLHVFLTFVKTEILASIGIFKLNNGMALTLNCKKNLQKELQGFLVNHLNPCKLQTYCMKIWLWIRFEKKSYNKIVKLREWQKQHIAFGC